MRELASLFIPIFLMTFSSSLFLFIEKLFFSRLAPEMMQAAVNVTYACRIFQAPCILLAMMAQVWVGRLYGSKQWESIGPVVWQFIWFSILSMLITVPLSIIYGKHYFLGTVIEKVAMPYYHLLIGINFLYPLAAALSCFYLGRGHIQVVLYARLASELLTILLSYGLIFGKAGMPRMGLIGGAIGTLIGQSVFCFLLLSIFLKSQHAKIYSSWNWRFSPKLFWESIQPGLLRGLSSALNMTCWASIAHLMIAKGGDYLLVLSIGGALFLFLACLGDALCQAMTTIVSQILGAKQYLFINTVFRSGSFLTLVLMILVGIVLFLCSGELFHHLFPGILLEKAVIGKIFLGVWLCAGGYMLSFVPISYILAFKDTKFSLLMGGISWVNGFMLMYFFIQKMGIPADQFWIVSSLSHFSSIALYYWRMKKLISRLGIETLYSAKM